MNTFQRIKNEIGEMAVFDTHEHIDPSIDSADLVEILKGLWLFTAFDLPEGKPDFAELSANLGRIRGQGHLRAAVRAIKDIYGVNISSLDENILRKASQIISKAYQTGGWSETILRKFGKIDVTVLDNVPAYSFWMGTFDRDFFAGSLNTDMFMHGLDRTEKDTVLSPYKFAQTLGARIESFDDYLAFIDMVFRNARTKGYVAIKSKIGYERGLRFEEFNEQDARRAYKKKEPVLTEKDVERFQDFIMHYTITKAIEVNFPIQIHTGMSYQTDYENSNPLRLANLFIEYPEAIFALFHGGYPWTSQIASLTFCHRNVYADLCWMPLISQTATERLISELIETTGGTRITWGGDTGIAEGAYGAISITKDSLARVLAEYVKRGYLSCEDATEIAESILFGNALEIYQT